LPGTRPLLTAAALAAVPLIGLAILLAGGWLGPWPALIAGVFDVAAALGLALVRAREYQQIVAEVRHAADGLPPPPGMRPRLQGEIGRTVRLLGQRSDLLADQLRMEASIIGALPDPLILLGPDRAVLRANGAAHAAFGAEMAAVLRHPGLRAAIDRTVALGTPQTAELALPVPVVREVHATVFRLAAGQVAAVLSDRTRERALERMRADFVANASHELRTPLASLIGFIDTLRGPAADDPPAQIRFLQIMGEQASRMNRLIDDLLSLSRIELTEHQPPTDTVMLPELLRFIAASFEPQVVRRGITLELAVPDDLPSLTGDDDQLGQVFQNLLDNAVKYGREGGSVRLSAAAVPPGGRWPSRPGVTIAVADDGAGIPREHVPRLTERFYRVDKGRSRAVGGTGLGLAIVKHIINRHRGQLVVDSREGEGATFTVWLPAGTLP
jgi:two-component system phosphate regulon sensor histidine kinase PhoR